MDGANERAGKKGVREGVCVCVCVCVGGGRGRQWGRERGTERARGTSEPESEQKDENQAKNTNKLTNIFNRSIKICKLTTSVKIDFPCPPPPSTPPEPYILVFKSVVEGSSLGRSNRALESPWSQTM